MSDLYLQFEISLCSSEGLTLETAPDLSCSVEGYINTVFLCLYM